MKCSLCFLLKIEYSLIASLVVSTKNPGELTEILQW